jgi:AAA family ATP:ADP antiporter
MDKAAKTMADKEQLEQQKYERLKLIFLGLAFFCVIGAYTLTKELKNSIFAYIVGREYIPLARTYAMIALMPAIFFYSYIVDRMRRYHVLAFYSVVYAILGLVFTFLLGNPYYGIPNTETSAYRLLGWVFYFFVEGFSPFVVSVFWAFANSISSPDSAKQHYGYMVSFSKVGGMLTAAFGWFLLRAQTAQGTPLYSDTVNHQILLFISSLLLLIVPIVLTMMMRTVPAKYLHGYEAAYRVERRKKRAGEEKTGAIAGLKMLLKYPYVMGIFGITFFYDLISVVLSYLSIGLAQSNSSTLSEVSYKLFEIVFKSHMLGFLISFFITGFLLRKLGVRWCLLLIPTTAGLVIANYMVNYVAMDAIIIAVVVLRAIHYSFSNPVRESLYIPTIKEINFKTRSWIDSFGSKFSKTAASVFNILASDVGSALFFAVYASFFTGVIALWFVTAYLIGRRFEVAVERNEVIGAEEE